MASNLSVVVDDQAWLRLDLLVCMLVGRSILLIQDVCGNELYRIGKNRLSAIWGPGQKPLVPAACVCPKLFQPLVERFLLCTPPFIHPQPCTFGLSRLLCPKLPTLGLF